MKQHARQTMLLLAAVCGEAVHIGAAAHSGNSVVGDVTLETTITYGIGAWRLHVMAPARRPNDVSVSDAYDCCCTLMVQDGHGRQTTVGVSYIEPSRRSGWSGTLLLHRDARSIFSVDASHRLRSAVAYAPYFANVDCAASRWDSGLGTIRSQWESVGMVPRVASVGTRVPASLLEKFGSGGAMVPGMTSAAFSSPGVVLLNGLGVILIGRQLWRRLL